MVTRILELQATPKATLTRWTFSNSLDRTSLKSEVSRVEPSFDRGESMAVLKDVFEIKEGYGTGHEPGVVAVLDRVLNREPTSLTGKIAVILTPGGAALKLRVDGAKDHGAATSLFFKDMTSVDIPLGSKVAIEGQLG